jgi:hypothetical protein
VLTWEHHLMKDKFSAYKLWVPVYMIGPTFLMACTIRTLIPAPGSRFPRAVGEPPRLTPAGSPKTRFSRRSLVPSATISFVIGFS